MARSDDGQVVRLEDYRPTDFLIEHVEMRFELFENEALVETVSTLRRREGTDPASPLVLDGDALDFVSASVNGLDIAGDRLDVSPDRLRVALPEATAAQAVQLSVRTRLRPEDNTQLMGLYRTNGVWCTQCEAEGFRRITYFLDRPDVLATYRVRVEADRRAAPVLLSNGNPVEAGALGDDRHFAVWDDPFPKPSYLFALVAGDLDPIEERFRTRSGRDVRLTIYTEKGLSSRAGYAMDALKRSMVWDERRFGLEYDLDVFNIVAVGDFNMGAMENKGLNVFNHKYVLLDPDTATDGDYQGVETVIAHEYFHNWTGNRITCRDWFQLCLKEGLTVYRDQEFTSDERSRAVKRIASVHTLKSHQFPEDQGPLQHPVRPTRYREINNFYTATVYEKGAELVRMIATILGETRFRAGMDLYFARHDGDAATIEDFIRCFEEAGETDLSQFSRWYAQAGTPTLEVRESFADGRLTLDFSQSLAPGSAGTPTAPLVIPIRFGLVDRAGRDIEAVPEAGSAEVEGDVILLTEPRASVVFADLPERPLVSVLRGFSAPVTLLHAQAEADRLALARLDPDPFGRWRALTDLVGERLRDGAKAGGTEAGATDPAIAEALIASVEDGRLEPALRAQMMQLPGEAEIARLIGRDVDPERVHAVREAVLAQIARTGSERLSHVEATLGGDAGFSPDAASAGRRALRNALLLPLSLADGSPERAARRYRDADNMTDRLAALTVLAHVFPDSDLATQAVGSFFQRFEDDALVMDKWFLLLATVPRPDTLERVEALAQHPLFRLSNPNRARALIGGFATGNQRAFNRADGAGYRWVAEQLRRLDPVNPQTAARLATAFRSWRAFEPVRQGHARAALEDLAATPGLSRDLADIVVRSLN
ncbi:aminopeptidase N [Aureimonas jatrophae]|uniref:Aminopeptidase N n=1 Tax=Aureimonas jatrophae TaxID=1166073 RepID=A0A1H0CRK5_9HYPH|nr:aminopeptidase N [Aureimonas jatrophae]MBB3949355.1 aminopeptidase N [Aureimonas jatrophae]SDN60510.1 aminopeptidase N [Aureimonas jatrophae]